jgi:hypothetical protein
MQQYDTGDTLGPEQAGQKIDDEDSRSNAIDAAFGVHLLSSRNTGEVGIDDSQAPGFGSYADRSMFGQRLTDPSIFPIFSSDDYDEVISGSVVAVEEIRNEAHEAEALRDNDEFIFDTELLKEVLLVLLR